MLSGHVGTIPLLPAHSNFDHVMPLAQAVRLLAIGTGWSGLGCIASQLDAWLKLHCHLLSKGHGAKIWQAQGNNGRHKAHLMLIPLPTYHLRLTVPSTVPFLWQG